MANEQESHLNLLSITDDGHDGCMNHCLWATSQSAVNQSFTAEGERGINWGNSHVSDVVYTDNKEQMRESVERYEENSCVLSIV